MRHLIMVASGVHPKNSYLLVIKGLRRSWQMGLNRVSLGTAYLYHIPPRYAASSLARLIATEAGHRGCGLRLF